MEQNTQLSRSDKIVYGTLQRFPELSYIAGPEWPELHWALIEQLNQYQTAKNDTKKEIIAEKILQLITSMDFITESWLIDNIKTEKEHLSSEPERGIFKSFWTNLNNFLHPPKIVCEICPRYPDWIPSGETKQVWIEFLPSELSNSGNNAEINSKIPIKIHAESLNQNILLLDSAIKSLMLNKQNIPESIYFDISGNHVGEGKLIVEIWQKGELLKWIPMVIHVEKQSNKMPDYNNRDKDFFEVGGFPAPEPDLKIWIRSQDKVLSYSLDFQNSAGCLLEAKLELKMEPEIYWAELRKELEQISNMNNPEAELIRIGNRLFKEFWPPELYPTLKAFIREDIRSVLIHTNDPWIPWEMMKPYGIFKSEQDKEKYENFFCLQFDIARWYMPKTGTRPEANIDVEHMGYVMPQFHDLPNILVERESIESLAKKKQLLSMHISPADRDNVLKKMEVDFHPSVNLWHFATHGDHDFKLPDYAPLLLEKDSQIRPNDFHGDIQLQLQKVKPFIFLNACRVGHGGRGLTGMGGWASLFVGNRCVSGMLAPLWAIGDRSACCFANIFYSLLFDIDSNSPMTIAKLVRLTREFVKKQYPNDPTWLAYSLSAHPNARISVI
jgi:hypothetical protein